MTIQEAYNKYKSIDDILETLDGNRFYDRVIFDLWQAIKEQLKEGENND